MAHKTVAFEEIKCGTSPKQRLSRLQQKVSNHFENKRYEKQNQVVLSSSTESMQMGNGKNHILVFQVIRA